MVSSWCRRPLRDICFVSRLAVSSFLDNFLVGGSVGSFFKLWYGPLSFREDIFVWYVSVAETTSASPLSAGNTLTDCSSFRRRSIWRIVHPKMWNSIQSQLSNTAYRWQKLNRPHRLKKTSSMQSKRDDPHPKWLHRETNDYISLLKIKRVVVMIGIPCWAAD